MLTWTIIVMLNYPYISFLFFFFFCYSIKLFTQYLLKGYHVSIKEFRSELNWQKFLPEVSKNFSGVEVIGKQFIYFCFLNFIIIIILLYSIVLVLPYINMHPLHVYTCSPSWTLLPPPSPYHPSGSSQCTSPKLPVSCIEPGLAICFLYDIIHVLMPFSQIILPSLSHRVQKTVLYICVSFSVSHTGLSLPSF